MIKKKKARRVRLAFLMRCDLALLRRLAKMFVVSDGFQLRVQLIQAAVICYEIVGDGNWPAFFQVFNFRPITLVNFARLHRSLGAFGHALIAQVFWCDDGDDGHLTREFVLENFVFAPGVQTV